MAKRISRSLAEMEAFGERLQQARTKCGINKSELARRCGVSIPIIQKYEAGQASPAYYIFYRMANVLGVSPEWLADGDKALRGKDDLIQSLTDKLTDFTDYNRYLARLEVATKILGDVLQGDEVLWNPDAGHSEQLKKRAKDINRQLIKLRVDLDLFLIDVRQIKKQKIQSQLLTLKDENGQMELNKD